MHANNNKSANTQLSSYLAHVYSKKKKKEKRKGEFVISKSSYFTLTRTNESHLLKREFKKIPTGCLDMFAALKKSHCCYFCWKTGGAGDHSHLKFVGMLLSRFEEATHVTAK